MTDAERERLIEAWRVILECARERPWKRLALARMTALIEERSACQVERMEAQRGLTRGSACS